MTVVGERAVSPFLADVDKATLYRVCFGFSKCSPEWISFSFRRVTLSKLHIFLLFVLHTSSNTDSSATLLSCSPGAKCTAHIPVFIFRFYSISFSVFVLILILFLLQIKETTDKIQLAGVAQPAPQAPAKTAGPTKKAPVAKVTDHCYQSCWEPPSQTQEPIHVSQAIKVTTSVIF